MCVKFVTYFNTNSEPTVVVFRYVFSETQRPFVQQRSEQQSRTLVVLVHDGNHNHNHKVTFINHNHHNVDQLTQRMTSDLQ